MSEKTNSVSRRDFIRDAAKVAAGATLTAAAPSSRAATYSVFPQTVLGANERILTGHIGVGQMGKRNMQFCLAREDIQPIAVCDLHPMHRQQAKDITSNKYPEPSEHQYFEEVIANKDVDAVVVVAPDHWHTIPSIMACEAGKDVWCEKPLTTSILEGQPIIDAVRKNKRVLQCGNFQRSGPHFQDAVQMIKEGYIGKVSRVETWIHDGKPLDEIGQGDENKPEWLDWDRYLGWTEKVPYNSNRYLYNFRWFLEYSGGKMTDWGAHLIDIVLWAMGEDKAPKRISSMGGKMCMTDNRTTPDTLEVLYEFDNYILSFSNRVWNGYVWRNRYGIMFYGTNGTLYLDREGYEVLPQNVPKAAEPKKVEKVFEGDMNKAHWQNFVDCVKSRQDPISFVESAFNTAKICHMGTTAYVAGGELGWDTEKCRFTSHDKEVEKKANDFAFRPYQNGWSLEPPYYKGWA